MRPMPVVVVQPVHEGFGSLPGAGIGTGVGPLPQAGLHQALGLAVGAGRVRSGAQVAHAKPADQATEAATPVPAAVIGPPTLEANAQASVVADRLQQCPAGTGAALVGLDGAERHP